VCSKSLWRSRLIRYFQNARARRDNTLSIVSAHKKKTGIAATTRCDKSTASYGVKHYLPERPAGETDDTIASLMKMMKDENKKFKKNRSRITELMNQTFADRRQKIVTQGANMQELQDCFPCLFNEDEVVIMYFLVCP
jgi:hypothetical protein